MKNEAVIVHDVKGDNFDTIQSKVDASKLRKLYGMLSNIYRNPIGSIVREYVSNAHDANIEARNFKKLSYNELITKYKWMTDPNAPGLNMSEMEVLQLKATLSRTGDDEPILTGVLQDSNGDAFFYAKDFGIGMSPARMKEIFFNYLSSTKEDTNDEIGGFGIGAKSALAYTHTFFIDTVYKDMEYNYIMSFDATGYPVGKMLAKKLTNKDNGTCIRVPIKNNNFSDITTFNNEINSKLLYMPNVYVDSNPFGCEYKGYPNHDINNSVLYNGGNWVGSDIGYKVSKTMHISLDNVSYTIDWNELSVPIIDVPIAILFKTGELRPTPSRESIIYTREAINLIERKILEVQDYFREFIKKSSEPTEDFFEFYKSYGSSNTSFTLPSGFKFDSEKILPGEKHTSGRPYKFFKDNNIPNNILECRSLYRRSGYINTTNAESSLTHNYTESRFSDFIGYSNQKRLFLITKSDTLKKKRNAFVLEKEYPYMMNMGSVNVYKKKKSVTLKYYISLLELDKKRKKDWRKIILGHQHISDIIAKRSHDYDVLINPNWSKSYDVGNTHYKPAAIKTADNGEIKIKKLNKTVYSTDKNDFIKKFDDFSKTKGIVFYATSDNTVLLSRYRDIFYTKHINIPNAKANEYVHFLLVYKKDIKKIDNLKMDTWYKVDKEEGAVDIAMIRKAVTGEVMSQYMAEIQDFVGDGNTIFKHVAPEFMEKLEILLKYKSSNSLMLSRDSTMKPVLEYMIQQGLYDKEIVNETVKINTMLSKNSLVSYFSDYELDSSPLSQTYDIAQIFIKMGIRVKDMFYNSRTSYLLHYTITNCLVKYENYLPYETSLWEDFNGENELDKDFK